MEPLKTIVFHNTFIPSIHKKVIQIIRKADNRAFHSRPIDRVLIDQTATCVEIKDAEGSWYFTFKYAFDKEMAKRGYITVDKGSVTVNGVSLTVCNPTDDTFQVAIIPYTYEYTNFHTFEIGSVVNIEFDIIGKYISRMIQYR